MKLLIGFLLLAIFFGCVTSTEPNIPELPIDDIDLVDQNIFGQNLNDVNGMNIDIDVNINRITFKYDINLSSPDLDVNVLARVCDASCNSS